jgi:hypothetical protein
MLPDPGLDVAGRGSGNEKTLFHNPWLGETK